MNVDIVKQIIETFGLIVSPLLAIGMTYYFARKILKCKDNTDKEIRLLKDALYYRSLIEKYKNKIEGYDNKNYYNTFRNEVDSELGYASSPDSTPSQIEKRLDNLHELNDKLAIYLSKFKSIG